MMIKTTWFLDFSGFMVAETHMSALRPWQKCPVAKVFQKNDEFEDWGTKAKKGRSIWWNLRLKT